MTLNGGHQILADTFMKPGAISYHMDVEPNLHNQTVVSILWHEIVSTFGVSYTTYNLARLEYFSNTIPLSKDTPPCAPISQYQPPPSSSFAHFDNRLPSPTFTISFTRFSAHTKDFSTWSLHR